MIGRLLLRALRWRSWPYVPVIFAILYSAIVTPAALPIVLALGGVLVGCQIHISGLRYVDQKHQESIDRLLEGQKLCFDMVYRGEQLRLQEIALSRKHGRA